MQMLERSALVSMLVDALHARGSWCGETHVQKAAYLLQELCEVPLQYDFILYKHGPFSFELRDELSAMRAYDLLALQASPGGYRPRFASTDAGSRNIKRHDLIVDRYVQQVSFIADQIGNKGVQDLERIATAFFVTKEQGRGASVLDRARRMNGLKPHIPVSEAAEAISNIDEIVKKVTGGREG